MPGKLRCWYHGGTAGRPRGIPMHPNTRAALDDGWRRWYERTKALKVAGVIEKFPNGRLAKRRGKRTTVLGRAIRFIEEIDASKDIDMVKTKDVVPTDTKQWGELNQPEKLVRNSDRGLDRIRDILNMDADPNDPDDLKKWQLIMNTALNAVSMQLRLDERRHDATVQPVAVQSPAERRTRLERELAEAFALTSDPAPDAKPIDESKAAVLEDDLGATDKSAVDGRGEE